jgi:hypothetical protein
MATKRRKCSLDVEVWAADASKPVESRLFRYRIQDKTTEPSPLSTVILYPIPGLTSDTFYTLIFRMIWILCIATV